MVHTEMRGRECSCICSFVCVRAFVCACMCVWGRACVCVHACMHACVSVCAFVNVMNARICRLFFISAPGSGEMGRHE